MDTTFDSQAASQEYYYYAGRGRDLTNYELSCVGNTGETTNSYTGGAKGCIDGEAPWLTAYADATFADGEDVLVCDAPDLLHSGYSRTKGKAFKLDEQGSSCEATIATGTSGGDQTVLTSSDSIELEQDYKNLNNKPRAAVTTACVGTVPSDVVVPSSIVTQTFPCTEASPFNPGTTISGEAVSATFPDGQYEEVCENPDQSTKVTATADRRAG